MSGSLTLAADSTWLQLQQRTVCHGGQCSPLQPDSVRGLWRLAAPPAGADFTLIVGTAPGGLPIELTITGGLLRLGTLIYERK